MTEGDPRAERRLDHLQAEFKLEGCPPIEEAVDRAHREWLAATQYFDAVSDPDLVDHAIYMMTAAERKYVYLLQQVARNRS